MSKILRVIVSGALLTFLAWRTDWVQVGTVFALLRMEIWVAAVLLYCLVQVVSGLRWQLLARSLGFERSLWQFTGFYFIGMYFNLVLPTSVGGDVVRAWYLDGQSGRRPSALLSVFVDRLSGLVVLLGLAYLATALSPIALPMWVLTSVWSTVGAVVLALVLLPVMARHRFLSRRYAKLSMEIRHALSFVFRPSIMTLSLVIQAANVYLVWMVGRAIQAPIPDAYYCILVPMVTLLTLLPISVNGMGVREGAMVLFLAPLGVSEGMALGLSFLWFSVFTTASLCGGAVYLFGRFPRPEVQADHEPVRYHSDQGRAGQSRAAA